MTPLRSRGDIARLGPTGYELDTTQLILNERERIKEQIIQYKRTENLMLFGDLYRLNDPLKENLFAEMIVSKNRETAYLTVFRPICIPNGTAIRVYPKGLDEERKYYIQELDLTRTGKTLMSVGLLVRMPLGDFQSLTYTFESDEKKV